MARLARNIINNVGATRPMRSATRYTKSLAQKVYDPIRFPQVAHVLCKEHGFTDKQLADVFGVMESTIREWINKYDEFAAAISTGKDHFDSNVVERKLLERATGYEYQEETISVVHDKFGNPHENITISKRKQPADIKAATFWLTNRRKDRWKQESSVNTVVSGGVTNTDRTLKITADLSKMDITQLRALRDMIAVQKTTEACTQDIENHNIQPLLEYARNISNAQII